MHSTPSPMALLTLALAGHFGFGLMVALSLSAFFFQAAGRRGWEYANLLLLGLVLAAECALICGWLRAGDTQSVWLWLAFWGAAALAATGVLSLFRKADLTMWIPFSLLFSPSILLPVFICLAVELPLIRRLGLASRAREG